MKKDKEIINSIILSFNLAGMKLLYHISLKVAKCSLMSQKERQKDLD